MELSQAERCANGIEEHSTAERKEGPFGLGDLGRLHEMADAFDHGNTSANGEDRAGDDQGPEVEFLSVTEGMLFVWRPAAALEAKEEKHVIESIHRGVERFREHCRAAADGSCDELGRRNEKVRSEGCDEGRFG
jgi:hypothetical protein